MKAGRHSNLAVRFGAILALGLLGGSGAQAASATGRASVTILAPETISVTAPSNSTGSPYRIENSSAAGFLSIRVRAEIPQQHYVASRIDGGAVLQSDQPAEITLEPSDPAARALVVVYHHY
jgi:hypothetical protein